MGRRGVGGRGSSEQASAPRYSGGSMSQRGPEGRQESWETLSSSAPPASEPRSSVPPQATRQRSRQGQKKPGRGATYSVVVMTIASLFGIGVLAVQAAATAPKVSNTSNKGASTATGQPTTNPSAGSAGGGGGATNAAALPANSGSGARIVYSEGAKRVWLVSSGNTVARTMIVVPGTVPAPTGSFSVTNKLSQVTGTDGTPVQYVVLFNKAVVGGGSATAFGFDAVANLTGMPPAPSSRTGGVRMAQADAQALFTFSSVGTTVVVVP